ncbi:MAG: thermonuclease family protein [Candidatus Thorarchaeota archaeon]
MLALTRVGICIEVDGSGTATYIVDGDTLDVSSVGRIRIADIDCPESDETGGPEAESYLYNLVYQKTVYADIDDIYGIDVYGRIVAVIYVQFNATNVKNVNKAMLVSGHATIWNFENEFDPYSWNLYELYSTGSDPPPEPPPVDPPSDDLPDNDPTPPSFPNNLAIAIVVSSAVGIGVAAVTYGIITIRKKDSQRSSPYFLPSKNFTSISTITPNSKDISVLGTIRAIQLPHTFQKKNGL